MGRGVPRERRVSTASRSSRPDSTTASISVRELGTHLGADPTAIYRHFRSKDELMQALLDELTVRCVAAVTAEPSDWRGRLRQLTSATLDVYAEYPAVGAEAILLTTHGPGELDAMEIMLEAFTVAGLTGDDVVHHYALLASHVLSSAAGIARARGARGDGTVEGMWFEGPILADPRTHPRIVSFAREIADLRDRDLFALGVESVIRSAEIKAAERTDAAR